MLNTPRIEDKTQVIGHPFTFCCLIFHDKKKKNNDIAAFSIKMKNKIICIINDV